MAANWLEVPENETSPREFFRLLVIVWSAVCEAARRALERVQNGTFTGPILGL